jgi:predicted nucleic acid-binding protein
MRTGSRSRDFDFRRQLLFSGVFNPRDSAHEAAIRASRELVGNLITTDWVLAEVADALSDPVNRGGCVEMIDDLRHSRRVEVFPATRTSFELGWELFGQRPDKNWSLTDCISFVVMRDRNVTEALTGDHHFEQAGFRALLKV